MSRRQGSQSGKSRGVPTAADMLHKATRASTSVGRANYAKRGLSLRDLDEETEAMLCRQLYLAEMEGGRFSDARLVAEQMVAIGVMPDVARQDAARACLGEGDESAALSHLRIASRVCPASRRAFHLWTLGSVLYLMGRSEQAVGVFSRALRWGTTEKPLYAAQLELAKRAHDGSGSVPLKELREVLEDSPCGQGYGQFVLGELAHRQGDFEAARSYLERFISRSKGGRLALEVALRGEIQRAEALVAELDNPPRAAEV